MSINPRAATARENARRSDGKFGSYQLEDAGTEAVLDTKRPVEAEDYDGRGYDAVVLDTYLGVEVEDYDGRGSERVVLDTHQGVEASEYTGDGRSVVIDTGSTVSAPTPAPAPAKQPLQRRALGWLRRAGARLGRKA